MVFKVDERIETSCEWLTDKSLSSLYLKNVANFPWVILVPRIETVKEIYQLALPERHLLMEEITLVSKIMADYFKPDKLNVGALGNIVSQLHIHIVARFKEDKAWPDSIWQPELAADVYEPAILNKHIVNLRELLTQPAA
ncbi:MAG: HIT domain-containing protein [Tatlockia sp.]|nr:HIT domain-containing protein [Tatlockia sp.]